MKFWNIFGKYFVTYILIGILLGIVCSIGKDMEFYIINCISYSGIGLLVGTVRAMSIDTKKQKKRVEEMRIEQIELPQKEKLPIYFTYYYGIYYLIFSVLIVALYFYYLYYANHNLIPTQINVLILSIGLGIAFLVTSEFASPSLIWKDKIIWLENKFSNKYDVVESKKNTKRENASIPEKIMYKLIKWSIYIIGIRIYEEYIKMIKSGYLFKIGTLTSIDKFSSSRHRHVVNRIFVELEQNYNFKNQIIIRDEDNYDKIIKEIAIIPKYKNINYIYCEDKEYANSVITETIQEKIANLATQVKEFSMAFYENKILLVLHHASWSTNFSRLFARKKNAENVLNSVEIIINALEQIAKEIENNNE